MQYPRAATLFKQSPGGCHVHEIVSLRIWFRPASHHVSKRSRVQQHDAALLDAQKDAAELR